MMVVFVTCAAECGEEDLKEDLHCELQLDTRVTFPFQGLGTLCASELQDQTCREYCTSINYFRGIMFGCHRKGRGHGQLVPPLLLTRRSTPSIRASTSLIGAKLVFT